MRRVLTSRLLGVALIVVLLVAWEVGVRVSQSPSPSLPPVSSVFVSWWDLLRSGELPRELGSSLYRMFLGYSIAAVLGVVLGLLMGYYRFFYGLLEPLVELLRPIPTPAYIPIAILFLGLDTSMKVFLIGIATFFPVLLNTFSGVRQVEQVQIDTGRTFGLGSARIVTRIVLPSAVPHIFTGLRVSLGIGLIMVVISEMVASNSGIGYFILQSQRSFHVTDMYAGIFTLAVVGYLLNVAFLKLEKRAVHW
jgi:ABC-type nitrate/sulfonate/bicarbonate transport system permease component